MRISTNFGCRFCSLCLIRLILNKKTHIANTTSIERVTDYLRDVFPDISSKSSIKKAIKNKCINVNGKVAKTSTWIFNGSIIDFYPLPPTVKKVYNARFDGLFEDDHIAVIAKPAGWLVSGNQFRTVTNALPNFLRPSNAEDKLPTPLSVHRLDSQTSGLLLIAKTRQAVINLSQQFELNKIKKTYHAIVSGLPNDNGIINSDIRGKIAETHFELLQSTPSIKNGSISLLKVNPKTGREHQIRIHLSSIGFPIMGDKLYNTSTINKKGLFLSATGIIFNHPVSNQTISLSVPLPLKFYRLLNKEERRYNKQNI